MENYDIWKKKVFEYFWKLCGDKALCDKMTDISTFMKVGNGECILEAGERTDYICLVISGLIRGFYIDASGNDITKCFSLEGDWCCGYSYLSKSPSPFYLETIENTVLAKFDIEKSNKILEEYPVMRDKVEQLLGRILMQSEKRLLSFTAMEAKNRYLSLLKEQPELVSRAKQEHIASYIGITPSSLSRIKKSLQLSYDNYK